MGFFYKIGALTSKPYAFVERAWELERYFSIDFFDNYGSTIYVDFFGLYVKRILPRINVKINGEWVTDRIRFFYDSLFIQRLSIPFFFKSSMKNYQPFSWFGVYWYFRSLKIFSLFTKFSVSFFCNFYYYLGLNIDLYSLVVLKNVFFSVISYNFITYSLYDSIFCNYDIIDKFFFCYDVGFFEKFELIYICGYNIRCEHPLLFFNLISKSYERKLKIFFFGVSFWYNINIFFNVGISFKDFYFFSKFFFLKRKKLKNVLLLIGSMFLTRYDLYIYNIFFNKIYEFCYFYNINFIFKFVYSNVYDNNLIFLGLNHNFRNIKLQYRGFLKKSNYTMKFLVFENNLYDWFFNRKIFGITIYVGSHFFASITYNLLLPLNFCFENDFITLSIFGLFIRSKFIYAPAELVKININYYLLLLNIFFKFNYRKNVLKNLFKNLKYISYFKNFLYFFFQKNMLKLFKFYELVKFRRFFKFYNISEKFIYRNMKMFLYNGIYLHYLNNFYIVNICSLLSFNLMLAFNQNEKRYFYLKVV